MSGKQSQETAAVAAVSNSVKRTLNAVDGIAGVPPLIVCPRCDGQAFDQHACGLCGNCGYLLADGAERLPFADMVQILATFSQAAGVKLAGTNSDRAQAVAPTNSDSPAGTGTGKTE